MKKDNYISPDVQFYNLTAEGLLCTSLKTEDGTLPDYDPSEGEW